MKVEMLSELHHGGQDRSQGKKSSKHRCTLVERNLTMGEIVQEPAGGILQTMR